MRTISIDRIGEKLVRRLAGHTSRRGILSRLGLAAYWTLIVGAQSRFGTAGSTKLGRSEAERRRSGLGERPFWDSIH